MRYSIMQKGDSRSFPKGDAFLAGASAEGDVAIYLKASVRADEGKTAILVELGTECLGVHTGEQAGEEGSNVVGFARYRNGDDPPSKLVELVRQPRTKRQRHRRRPHRVRGRRLDGRRVLGPARPHHRSSGTAEVQRGAALPR